MSELGALPMTPGPLALQPYIFQLVHVRDELRLKAVPIHHVANSIAPHLVNPTGVCACLPVLACVHACVHVRVRMCC